MNEKQSILSSNFGSLEDKVNVQMDTIDKKTAETQNNLKDLQHVTNTFDDKVANFSKSLRMEFRETKDDMVKKIDEHVQLAIQDSRARNEDLEDRIQASVKKHETTVKSLEVKVGEMESVQKNSKSNSEGNIIIQHCEFNHQIRHESYVWRSPLSKIALMSASSAPDVENVLVSDDANVLLFHGLQLVSYQGKESF